MKALAATLAALALSVSSAGAADVASLTRDVNTAAAGYLQGAYYCVPLLGNAPVTTASNAVKSALVAEGLSGGALSAKLASMQSSAKAHAAGQTPLLSLIGKNGVTRAAVSSICQSNLSQAKATLSHDVAKLKAAKH